MTGKLPRRALLAGGAAMAAPLARAMAQPAAWPTQPMRLVVPFAPGGTTDIVARLLSQGLAERLGQPVIIENRPGAGATLGSLLVAQAAPDGHTLLISNIASHGIAPTLYPGLRYDAVADFTHVALLITNPVVFVANPNLAAHDLAGVIRLGRESPRGLDLASSGAGSSNHLLIVEFGRVAGIPVHHVPYRGAGPAMTDVIAGVVPLMSDSLPSAAGHLRAGSVRGIAISSAARHPAFPGIPTFREQGMDLVSRGWFGLSGPAGLPAAITERLARAVAAVLAEPGFRDRIADLGGAVEEMSPAGFTAFVAAEVAGWAPVVRASGARVD